MWLIDKQFEFTAHHDLETCKQLLMSLQSSEKPSWLDWFSVNIDRVTYSHESEPVTITIRQKMGRISYQCKATLREGPDATVVVSGYVRMSWLWLYTCLIGCYFLLWALITVNSPSPLNAPVCAGLWIVISAVLFLSAVYDRRQLENMIVAVLTDRGKVKKK